MSQTKVRTSKNIVERIRPAIALPILALFGFSLRLFLLQFRFAVAFDEVNYLKLGVSGYLNGIGDILHTYWSPLLPGLIALACHFFDDYELAGRMVSILASTLLVFPVFALGKFVYDETVGIAAAGFVALFPPLAFQSTLALTEPIYMLSATLAILFGLRMLKQYSTGFAALAGLCGGCAYLAHPQGIGFIMLLATWLVIGSLSKRFLIQPLRLVWMLVPLVLTFLVIAAPYFFYLKKETGKWTLSAKGAANWQMDAPKNGVEDPFRSLDPSNTIVPIDQIFHKGDFLHSTNGKAKPLREVHLKPLAHKYFKNLAEILRRSIPELFTTVPLILLGIGLFGRAWQAQHGIVLIYLLSFVGFFWFAVIPAFHINLRYFLPLLPMCSIWIGKGALHVQDWLATQLPLARLKQRRKMRSGNFASGIVLSAFLALTFLPEFGRVISRTNDSRDYWADPVDQKKVGVWLKQQTTGPKIIMSRGHAVDFYAGNYEITQSVTIPKNSLDRLLVYARHRGANYLVVNERYKDSYPKIGFLLTSTEPVPGLKLIYDEKDESNLLTRIYQIL